MAVRINVSRRDCLEDAYFLNLFGNCAVVHSTSNLYIYRRANLGMVKAPYGVYSSNIFVYRTQSHRLAKTPFEVDFITFPSVSQNIRSIFESIWYFVNQHPEITSLVFVPNGYGVDTNDIAECLNYFLKSYKFGNVGNIIISCYITRDYDIFKSTFHS